MPTEYFEQRERALLGQRYEQLYAAPQQTAERGVTVSALRTTPEQFAQRADFPLEPSPFCKAAFVVHQPDFKPGRHPYHHAGVFYSQEPSASSAAPLLGVQPGMRVLDLCAAPGGKTILLARFVPIVRAFAPLIAGAARMNGIRFELFSGAGAILWAVSIVGAGYLFGNIPFIKNNLSLILLLGIIAAISGPVLVGMVWKFIQKRKGLDAEDPQK